MVSYHVVGNKKNRTNAVWRKYLAILSRNWSGTTTIFNDNRGRQVTGATIIIQPVDVPLPFIAIMDDFDDTKLVTTSEESSFKADMSVISIWTNPVVKNFTIHPKMLEYSCVRPCVVRTLEELDPINNTRVTG